MRKYFIGIDVSKTQLDVYVSGLDRFFKAPDTEKGLQKLLKNLSSWRPCLDLIVCKPTGGYERLLVHTCLKSQLPIHRAHPNKICAFVRASGRLAKTDKINAQMISQFAQTFALKHNMKPLDPETLHLKALSTQRQQLIGERIRETNRLDVPLAEVLKSSIQRPVQWLNQEIERINQEIDLHLDHQKSLQGKITLMTSYGGSGVANSDDSLNGPTGNWEN